MMTDAEAIEAATALRDLIETKIEGLNFQERAERRERMDELAQRLKDEWGRRVGWEQATRSTRARQIFLPHELEFPRQFFDHASTWRFPRWRGPLYAIASHLYEHVKQKDVEAFCREHNLRAEFPVFPSWWYPGRTVFIWWTRIADDELSGAIGGRRFFERRATLTSKLHNEGASA
jgi:hypothetical protein